ncbi:MAG: hypothetical protein LBK72_03855 [Bifidobacteriaceae bacterium]|nr:hypothetical protein [Bifidobacteriaceae bacterium]
MPKRQLVCHIAVVAAGVMVLAGCTEDGAPDVASLGEVRTADTAASAGTGSGTPGDAAGEPGEAGASEPGGGTASADGGGAASADAGSAPARSQREGADDLYACLLAAGIEAEITDYLNGQAWVEILEDHSYGVTSNGMSWRGKGEFSEADSAASSEIWEQAKPTGSWNGMGSIEGEPKVMIDGLDMTEAFDGCVMSSGYTSPEVPKRDAGEQLRYRQRVAEAGNVWAACAREHGFESVKDVTATSDTNYTPTVLLPVTVTAERLERLVEDCPTFDPEAELEYYELRTSDELTMDEAAALEAPVRPFIGFDTPGWNGDKAAEDKKDEEAAEAKRLAALEEILLRPYGDFLDNEIGNAK